MSDLILQFKDIHKAFFGVPVLKGIDLDVERGSTVGLVGENGAGKSTLVNILGGVVPATSGQILLKGEPYEPHDPRAADEAGIAFIHQELNLFTNLSIAENFYISDFPTMGRVPLLNRRDLNSRAREYLAMVDLEVSPDMRVERLAPGERQLVEVAKALSMDASIIIFDEPTTSLTARETERLFKLIDRLHDDGKTIIYISHILGDVMRLSDAVAVLRDGNLVTKGPVGEFTIDRMISSMVGRDIESLYPDRTAPPTEELTLEVRNLSKAGISHQIDLTLHKGEVLGVFGLMGSGRSELAEIIFGLEDFDEGEILINGQTADSLSPTKNIKGGMAFVTENRREEGLMMEATVSDNLTLAALPDYTTRWLKRVRTSAMVKSVKETVEILSIKVNDAFKNEAKGLSGGNQQKVVLGKWLMTEPSILIIDEPTRGVDVGAKFEIYEIIDQIAAKGTAVLFISSEIEELTGMCDRIMVMGQGEMLGAFDREDFDKEAILRTAFRENGA
ncbi:MAG: sugar ABC transporter ATP-binding protein [Chloroflexota bacterium]|nr:sugar ABC transporter ATP-binding protein [Chloroflexota bacterium]